MRTNGWKRFQNLEAFEGETAMTILVRALVVLLAAAGPYLLCGCKGETKKRVAPPPDVTVAQPVQQEVTRYLEYTGTTAALQSVDIRARVPGFLQKICFEPRARVKSGDLLFVIDPRQYEATVKEANAKLESQKAASKLAQTELQINQQLLSKEAISALKLEKKAAERDVSAAEVDLAEAALDKAKLDLEWTQVTSPIDGRVSRNLVDVGNLVGATEKTLLTTVVSDDIIYTYFNIGELDLLPLRRKQATKSDEAEKDIRKVPVQLGLADETGYPHEGHFDFADTKVDPATGTVQVRGIFPNPGGILMAGMFVRVRVPVDTQTSWLVPEVAVQADQGGSYVLTVGPENVVEQRRVKVGTTIERMQVIAEGLAGDEKVIVAGLQRARPGSKVNPVTAQAASPEPGAGSQGKPQKK